MWSKFRIGVETSGPGLHMPYAFCRIGVSRSLCCYSPRWIGVGVWVEVVRGPLAYLSAFAEDHGRKPVDECAWRTLRSSARPVEYSPRSIREPPSENLLHGASGGGCFGGFRRRRNQGYHRCKPMEASFRIGVNLGSRRRDHLHRGAKALICEYI